MMTKALSLMALAAILIIYPWAALRPNDPLFFFASNNMLSNALLIALASGTVLLAFTDKLKQRFWYAIIVACSAALVGLGVIGFLSAGVDYMMLSVFGPLDYIIVLELGIIGSVCALNIEHRPLHLKLPKLKLVEPRWIQSLDKWLPGFQPPPNRKRVARA